MSDALSRREFLQASALGAVALTPPTPILSPTDTEIGRVTTDWIGAYQEPSFRSKRLKKIMRDEIITLFGEVTSDEGPRHNPLWHEVIDGYAHSGYIQRVRWDPQTAHTRVPEDGALFEVSVPYTRAYAKPDTFATPLYRLYFQSTAWVMDSVRAEDGRIWYSLMDDLLRLQYYARAEHFRYIRYSELAPISPEIPQHRKHITVNLSQQELLCFEESREVFRTRISSGIPDTRPRANGIPTITPSGDFFIEVKTPLRHMGEGSLVADLDAYELPGVPWVSFFTATGVAFHGTYWHSDFGRPRSQGCINMRPADAKWLFRWTTPAVAPDQIRRIGRGTHIRVF
jgi:hypothetical protein